MTFFSRRKMLCATFFLLQMFFIFAQVQSKTIDAQTSANTINNKYSISSGELYQLLLTENLSPKKIPNNSESLFFPYNIVVTITPSTTSLANTDNVQSNHFVLSIAQEDALFFIDEVIAFAKVLSQKELFIPVSIFFSAQDYSVLSFDAVAKGTKNCIKSLDATMAYSAIILKPDNLNQLSADKTLSLVPGSNKLLSPLWLVRQIFKNADASGKKIDFFGTFLALYRMGFMSETPALYEYLKNNIPSTLLIANNPDIFDIFLPLVDFLSQNQIPEWDSHYSMFAFSKVPSFLQNYAQNGIVRIFISEPLFVFILLVFSFVPLFFLCVLPFFKQKNKVLHLDDFKKSWFLIPFMVLATWLLLQAGEYLTKEFFVNWQSNLFVSLILKVLIALLFLCIISLLHRFVHFPSRDYVYSLFVLVLSFANVFVFSFFDISLILIFFLQFLIACATVIIKKKTVLLIFGFLMVMPFTPFLAIFFSIHRDAMLYQFFDATLTENLLIALLVLPAEFTWMRIIVQFKLFGKNAKSNFPVLITVASFILLCTICFLLFSPHKFYQQTNKTLQVQKSNAQNISANYEVYHFLERTKVDLTLGIDAKPIYFDVTIYTHDGIAIFDANYPFETKKHNQEAHFILDEYPPNPFKLEFTAERGSELNVQIVAFYNDENGITQEEKTLLILCNATGGVPK